MAKQSTEEFIHSLSPSIPFLPHTLPTHAPPLLHEAARNLIKEIYPHFSEVKLTVCTDGITNKLLKGTYTPLSDITPSDIIPSDTVEFLIRSYGSNTSTMINRHTELLNHYTLHKLGYASPIIAVFQNGFVYGFVKGRVLKNDELNEDGIWQSVALAVGEWHRVVKVRDDGSQEMEDEVGVWKTISKWIDQIPKVYDDPIVNDQFLRNQNILNPVVLREQLRTLKDHILTNTNSPTVFAHNDMLSANIIYHPVSPTPIEAGTSSTSSAAPSSTSSQMATISQRSISFIDYEYATPNPQAYDISNHFLEFAGFQCDFSNLPSIPFRRDWIRIYLSEYLLRMPTDEEVEKLVNDVSNFESVSHLYWGVWALVKAKGQRPGEFDYMAYAELRVSEYFKTSENRGYIEHDMSGEDVVNSTQVEEHQCDEEVCRQAEEAHGSRPCACVDKDDEEGVVLSQVEE